MQWSEHEKEKRFRCGGGLASPAIELSMLLCYKYVVFVTAQISEGQDKM